MHFLPIAAEVNAELRPLILERAQANGTRRAGRAGVRRPISRAGAATMRETLFRVLRELANALTATRAGARLTLDWKITACAAVRQKGEYQEMAARPGAFWSGIYYVDDGYAKSDDEALGGECELADPRGRIAGDGRAATGVSHSRRPDSGQSEVIRPQSGMIILHPSWLPRGERRYEGPAQRSDDRIRSRRAGCRGLEKVGAIVRQ